MADFYAFVPLPPAVRKRRRAELIFAAAEAQRRSGATYQRVTLVTEDNPLPGLAPGVYVQGWIAQPDDDAFEWPEDFSTLTGGGSV